MPWTAAQARPFPARTTACARGVADAEAGGTSWVSSFGVRDGGTLRRTAHLHTRLLFLRSGRGGLPPLPFSPGSGLLRRRRRRRLQVRERAPMRKPQQRAAAPARGRRRLGHDRRRLATGDLLHRRQSLLREFRLLVPFS
jgi:hypothetical protein